MHAIDGPARCADLDGVAPGKLLNSPTDLIPPRKAPTMTSPNLAPDLQRDEGLNLHAYPDPISHGAPWTIGYGHTGPGISKGVVWTLDQANQALARDIAHAEAGLDAQLAWWRQLDDVRQDCLVNMTFNMGIGGVVKFNTFLGLLKAGKYLEAAADLAGTAWHRQIGQRAVRVERQIQTGVHQA